jgi:hypothetical protein
MRSASPVWKMYESARCFGSRYRMGSRVIRSNNSSARCAKSSWPTRWSRISPTPSNNPNVGTRSARLTPSFVANVGARSARLTPPFVDEIGARGSLTRASHFVIAAFLVLFACASFADTLVPVPTRDVKIIRQWQLPGDPHGVAVARDGTIYVGLAQSQSVAAIDPGTGEMLRNVVLDHAEIASTKELVTLRLTNDGKHLLVANGSDESATILSVPELTVEREITIEGEPIRDALPDPEGHYIVLLGRRVHIYDWKGEVELHRIDFTDAMAVAVSSTGSLLAVLGSHDFGNGKVTVAALYGAPDFKELDREPMQTDRPVEAALFAARDQALIALGRQWIFEKPISGATAERKLETSTSGPMRMRIDFGDLVNSRRVCLPDDSGPQVAALASPTLLYFAEKRCSSSGVFSGSAPKIVPASLYGVSAYAIAFDSRNNTLVATDRKGSLTIYKAPRVPIVR